MAKKITGPQMILSNRLDDGRVVFFTRDGGWSPETNLAAHADDDGIAALAEKAEASVANNTVVGIEIIPAKVNADGTAFPAHIKHVMQTKGPSVRDDLGYQVSLDWEAN